MDHAVSVKTLMQRRGAWQKIIASIALQNRTGRKPWKGA
jgi:hypothetical protein